MIKIRWPYWLAFALCLAAVAYVSLSEPQEASVVGAAPRTVNRTTTPASLPMGRTVSAASSVAGLSPETWHKLDIRAQSTTSATASAPASLFATRDWTPPPPPPPKPQKIIPSPPQAPPLPFQYMGRLQEEGGKQQVYLVNGDMLYTVKVGDTLDGQYKVQKIDRQEMILVYLPLNQTQTLPIASN